MRAFLDTNVLVYSVDVSEPRKREIARSLLADRAADIVLSAQVLSEFYTVVTRRLAESLAPDDAAAYVDDLSDLPVVPVDSQLVRDAIRLSRSAQLAYWDGLIVAAARTGGCEVLLTEDLSRGATIAGVRIENPFTP